MNNLINYLFGGVKFVFISWIIIWLAFSIYIIPILIIVLYIFISVLAYLSESSKNYETVDSDCLQSYANNLANEYNIDAVRLYVSDETSGRIIYFYKKPHELLIPEYALKKDENSKAVIAHELAHIINNDKRTYTILSFILLNIASIMLYLSSGYIFGFITILLLLCIPAILNMVNHIFEYEADKFAVKHTSKRIISHRLRTNKLLNPWYRKYFPYIMPHPSIEKRIKKIYNY